MSKFFIFITAYASSDSENYYEEETYGYQDDDDVIDPDWCLDDPDGPLGENATETVDEQL